MYFSNLCACIPKIKDTFLDVHHTPELLVKRCKQNSPILLKKKNNTISIPALFHFPKSKPKSSIGFGLYGSPENSFSARALKE